MSGFLTPLQVEYLDGHGWKIHESFEYVLGDVNGAERVIVPIGFVTDFASVPRLFWNVLPPTGKYGKAAVIHDYLYQYRFIVKIGPLPDPAAVRLCERGEADRLLKEGMEVLGVGKVTRWVVYAGVRVGGWAAWQKYRKQEAV
jgi:hypothetical protein